MSDFSYLGRRPKLPRFTATQYDLIQDDIVRHLKDARRALELLPRASDPPSQAGLIRQCRDNWYLNYTKPEFNRCTKHLNTNELLWLLMAHLAVASTPRTDDHMRLRALVYVHCNQIHAQVRCMLREFNDFNHQVLERLQKISGICGLLAVYPPFKDIRTAATGDTKNRIFKQGQDQRVYYLDPPPESRQTQAPEEEEEDDEEYDGTQDLTIDGEPLQQSQYYADFIKDQDSDALAALEDRTTRALSTLTIDEDQEDKAEDDDDDDDEEWLPAAATQGKTKKTKKRAKERRRQNPQRSRVRRQLRKRMELKDAEEMVRLHKEASKTRYAEDDQLILQSEIERFTDNNIPDVNHLEYPGDWKKYVTLWHPGQFVHDVCRLEFLCEFQRRFLRSHVVQLASARVTREQVGRVWAFLREEAEKEASSLFKRDVSERFFKSQLPAGAVWAYLRRFHLKREQVAGFSQLLSYDNLCGPSMAARMARWTRDAAPVTMFQPEFIDKNEEGWHLMTNTWAISLWSRTVSSRLAVDFCNTLYVDSEDLPLEQDRVFSVLDHCKPRDPFIVHWAGKFYVQCPRPLHEEEEEEENKEERKLHELWECRDIMHAMAMWCILLRERYACKLRNGQNASSLVNTILLGSNLDTVQTRQRDELLKHAL